MLIMFVIMGICYALIWGTQMGVIDMADYKKMYLELFGATTKAIDLLQKAQINAEERYISSEEAVIQLMTKEKIEEDGMPK